MTEAVTTNGYRCLICTESYTEPRLLLCGHTFCCRCLSSYISTEYVTADDTLYFPCPVCETPMYNDDVNEDVSTWATCFPKHDLLVSSTAQISGVQLCEPCLRGKESTPAEVTCVECDEQLCKNCKIHHERSKVLATHQLISLSGNVGLLAGVYEMCYQHDENPFDFFCVDHSAMCCNTCVLVSHRQCNNVKPMKDVIKKNAAKLNPVEAELKAVTEESNKMIDIDDMGIAALNAKEKEVLSRMEGTIDKAKDKLDNLKAIFQLNVAVKFREHKEQLLSRQKSINAFHLNAENSHQLLSDLDQHLSERHRFFLKEHTKDQILRHYRRMDKKTKTVPNRFDVTLTLDETIDKILQMTTIGDVEIISSLSPVSQKSNDRITSLIRCLPSTTLDSNFSDSTLTADFAGSLQSLTVKTTHVPTSIDVWTGSVSCIHTINANTLGGVTTPWLTGGIFTHNNELLIADFNNSRLLLFSDNFLCQREYKVDGYPTDIAHGHTGDEIFVAVFNCSILRCTLQNCELSVTNRISSPYKTLGIEILGENILAGTPDSVEVISIDGQVTKSIKKERTNDNTYLAVSAPSSTVYNRDGDDVVCRRIDSDTVVYRYSDPGLNDPISMGLDRNHNVYVCGNSSGNIYLISPDGSRGMVLLPKLSGISNPWCIVVHPTKQEFVVTSNRESTSLEVYRFGDDKM